MAMSILYWSRYVENHTKLTRKSEAAVESDRVLKFVLDKEFNVITAIVQASMRDTSYKVQVFLEAEENSTGTINSATCECPMGQFRCHHVAATLLYGYKRASKTDLKCSWIKHPKSAPPKTTTTMAELYPPKQQEYRSGKISKKDREYYCQSGDINNGKTGIEEETYDKEEDGENQVENEDNGPSILYKRDGHFNADELRNSGQEAHCNDHDLPFNKYCLPCNCGNCRECDGHAGHKIRDAMNHVPETAHQKDTVRRDMEKLTRLEEKQGERLERLKFQCKENVRICSESIKKHTNFIVNDARQAEIKLLTNLENFEKKEMIKFETERISLRRLFTEERRKIEETYAGCTDDRDLPKDMEGNIDTTEEDDTEGKLKTFIVNFQKGRTNLKTVMQGIVGKLTFEEFYSERISTQSGTESDVKVSEGFEATRHCLVFELHSHFSVFRGRIICMCGATNGQMWISIEDPNSIELVRDDGTFVKDRGFKTKYPAGILRSCHRGTLYSSSKCVSSIYKIMRSKSRKISFVPICMIFPHKVTDFVVTPTEEFVVCCSDYTLRRFAKNGDVIQHVSRNESLSCPVFIMFTTRSDKGLFILIDSEYVYTLNERLNTVDKEKLIQRNSVRGLSSDSHGTVLCAYKDSGFWSRDAEAYSNDTFTQCKGLDSIPSGRQRIVAIAFDEEDRLWVAKENSEVYVASRAFF